MPREYLNAYAANLEQPISLAFSMHLSLQSIDKCITFFFDLVLHVENHLPITTLLAFE